MLGIAIILVFTALGAFAGQWLNIPGPLVGLLLLAAGLTAGVVKEKWVAGGGDFLLRHLMLFFLPPALGILDYLVMLGRQIPAILVVVVLSTALTMAVTGWVAQLTAGGGGSDA